MNTFFLHQIKRTNGTFDKGIVVKSGGTSEKNFAAAKQGYHAYLGAYAYDHDPNTDYVQCMITDMSGRVIEPFSESWEKAEPEPAE
jgi:hypothetical protein